MTRSGHFWYLTFIIFKCPLFIFLKKIKYWNLDIFCNLSNWSNLLNWKGPGTWPQFSTLFKRFLKIIALVYISQLAKSGKFWFQRYIQKCTLSHYDLTASVNHGIVKNTKTWISWERNTTFLRSKRFLACASDDLF